MNKIINTWRLFRLLLKSGHLLPLLTKTFEFVNLVSDDSKPRLTQIAHIHPATNELEPIVSLWAGVGAANPIERIRQLKAQNEAMKQVIREMLANEQSPEQKQQIEMMINVFE